MLYKTREIIIITIHLHQQVWGSPSTASKKLGGTGFESCMCGRNSSGITHVLIRHLTALQRLIQRCVFCHKTQMFARCSLGTTDRRARRICNCMMSILVSLKSFKWFESYEKSTQIHGQITPAIVEFKFISTVTMRSAIFLVLSPYSSGKVHRRFTLTYRLHLQGRSVNQARNEQ